ncbi:unnamed protein product, partial [Oppiella nova]
MVFRLLPRRLRLLGVRRISTPVLAIILVVVVIVVLISVLPSHDIHSSSADTRDSRGSAQSWRQSPVGANDGEQVVRPDVKEVSNNLPQFRDQMLGNFEDAVVGGDAHPSGGGPRPGDNGHKYLLEGEGIDWNEVNAKKNEYGMNIVASDHIPMDRSVPDLRHDECK